MAPIAIRGERAPGTANNLAPGEVDSSWLSLHGSPSSLTISSGVLSVNGSGTYRVSAETGSTDDLTSIAGAQRVGDEVYLLATSGHTITVVHAGTLHLSGVNFVMDTAWSIIKLKCIVISPMTWVEISRSYNP